MKEKIYNKLVRDRIPEIINSTGSSCETRVLSDEEYLQMLDEKLNEELLEYQADKSVQELADLLEVIYAAAQAHGCTASALDEIRRKKAQERGAFDEKILLVKTFEK